jgi:hypothetical protein
MSRLPVPPVGLYSIGIRGLGVSALLSFAAANDVPFIHLRGGPSGYDLARQGKTRLARWARQARGDVPVTMVTADLDLADFLPPGPQRRDEEELARLADAAESLGAATVRLLARQPPAGRTWDHPYLQDIAAQSGTCILVELHHPDWFTPPGQAMLGTLLGESRTCGVLLDTAQFHDAITGSAQSSADSCLHELVARTRAVHLADTGAGLADAGHTRAGHVALAAIRSGHQAEVAFEWTGPDRNPGACFARYQAALAWWQRLGTQA